MKYLIICTICLNSMLLSAQDLGKVYYHKHMNVMGNTKTLLYSQDSVFILQRNFTGYFGRMLSDTLYFQNGILKGKNLEISLKGKKMHLLSLDSLKWKSPLKMKEYGICDPFINFERNWWYAHKNYYKVKKTALKELGDSQPEWEKRVLHESEHLDVRVINRRKSIFSRICADKFKVMADSVYHANMSLIGELKSRK